MYDKCKHRFGTMDLDVLLVNIYVNIREHILVYIARFSCKLEEISVYR